MSACAFHFWPRAPLVYLMAENKREEWEIERDRVEIAQLRTRFPNITHQRIADILFQRRTAEYKEALKELDALDADSVIPNAPPAPYKLTRQMIDYDFKKIRADWRKESRQKYEEHLSAQLARAYELHSTAYEGYERSIGEINEIQESKTTIEFKTTIDALMEHVDGDAHALLSTKNRKQKISLPGATSSTTRRKKAQLLGDPRFLLVADRAEERIDKLLGLHEPQEINVNTPGAADIVLVQGFNPEKWDATKPDAINEKGEVNDNPDVD